MPLPLLPLAGAALLAWLASQRSTTRAPQVPKGGNGQPGPNVNPNPTQNGDGGGGGAPQGQGVINTPGNASGDTTTDSNGNIVPVDAMMNNGNGQFGVADFYAQVATPAAAIALEDLTQDDIADALAFMSGGGKIGSAGKFGRRDELGTLYHIALSELNTAQTGQETASIVGAIESIIPFVGGALSAANGAASNAIAGSAGNLASDMGNLVATTVTPQTIGSNPLARAIMDSSYGGTAGGESPLTRDLMQSPTALQGAGTQGFAGYTHARLLTKTPYGWMFPWLCNWFDGLPNNLQGSGSTIVSRATRNMRRARLFRTVDLLISKYNAARVDKAGIFPPIQYMFDGVTPMADENQTGAKGLYWYHNDTFGDLYASVLPPSNWSAIGGKGGAPAFFNGPNDYLKDPAGNWRLIDGGAYQKFVPTRAYSKQIWTVQNTPSGPVVVVTKTPTGSVEGDQTAPNPLATANDPQGLYAAYVNAHADIPPMSLLTQWLASGAITQAMFDQGKSEWDLRAAAAAKAAAAAAAAANAVQQQKQIVANAAPPPRVSIGTVGTPPHVVAAPAPGGGLKGIKVSGGSPLGTLKRVLPDS